PASWRVAVALHPEKMAAGRRTGPYVAANYDALVDAPVEMGVFEEFPLGTGGPPVRVVVHGDAWKRGQVEETLRRIVSYEIQLMRGAPFDEYVFLYHIGSTAGGGSGGMEHAHSTAIFIDSMGYFENVSAHEFFHLWNVKRIRPQSLEPVDYTGEQWTRSLWFAEGVTSSYASYTLVRTGLWTRKQFYDDLAGQVTDLELRPARRWQSVEQASLDAWFEKYPLYRRPDFSISYYNKGQILGVLLDLLIRDATDDRSSLDDVLRDLNDRFASQGRFYRDSADIRASAERIAGRSFEEFFTRYVAGTDDLPCAEILARAGLVLKDAESTRAEFGFLAVRGGAGAAIVATEIEPGSAAEQAGVREGDVLLTLNGAAFPRNPIRWLHEHRPGEIVRLGLRHENNLKEVNFALSERRERVYSLEEAGNPTEKQRRILDGLLHGTTDGPRP
ncbi:MAG: PDZ domain-containing protein, partial [Candidatus Acidiferrales bacterium]